MFCTIKKGAFVHSDSSKKKEKKQESVIQKKGEQMIS